MLINLPKAPQERLLRLAGYVFDFWQDSESN
jgi:hypothetical protein